MSEQQLAAFSYKAVASWALLTLVLALSCTASFPFSIFNFTLIKQTLSSSVTLYARLWQGMTIVYLKTHLKKGQYLKYLQESISLARTWTDTLCLLGASTASIS